MMRTGGNGKPRHGRIGCTEQKAKEKFATQSAGEGIRNFIIQSAKDPSDRMYSRKLNRKNFCNTSSWSKTSES